MHIWNVCTALIVDRHTATWNRSLALPRMHWVIWYYIIVCFEKKWARDETYEMNMRKSEVKNNPKHTKKPPSMQNPFAAAFFKNLVETGFWDTFRKSYYFIWQIHNKTKKSKIKSNKTVLALDALICTHTNGVITKAEEAFLIIILFNMSNVLIIIIFITYIFAHFLFFHVFFLITTFWLTSPAYFISLSWFYTCAVMNIGGGKSGWIDYDAPSPAHPSAPLARNNPPLGLLFINKQPPAVLPLPLNQAQLVPKSDLWPDPPGCVMIMEWQIDRLSLFPLPIPPGPVPTRFYSDLNLTCTRWLSFAWIASALLEFILWRYAWHLAANLAFLSIDFFLQSGGLLESFGE